MSDLDAKAIVEAIYRAPIDVLVGGGLAEYALAAVIARLPDIAMADENVGARITNEMMLVVLDVAPTCLVELLSIHPNPEDEFKRAVARLELARNALLKADPSAAFYIRGVLSRFFVGKTEAA